MLGRQNYCAYICEMRRTSIILIALLIANAQIQNILVVADEPQLAEQLGKLSFIHVNKRWVCD